MKHLQEYKLFENRQESISKIESLRPKKALLVKVDIDFEKINFKDIAKTWWGKNVSNLNNILKKMEGTRLANFEYKRGEVPFISFGGGFGYPGFIFGRDRLKHSDGYFIEKEPRVLDDDESSLFGILLQEGFCEIVDYNDLDEGFRNEFEIGVKASRVNDCVNEDKKVFVEDSEGKISEGSYLYSTINLPYLLKNDIFHPKAKSHFKLKVIEDNKEQEYVFEIKNILDIKFLCDESMSMGDYKEINKDPFIE